MFRTTFASPRSTLSPQQALELARVYLENAGKATDAKIFLVLCHDAKTSLSQARKANKDPSLNKEIATTYTDLGQALHDRDYHVEAQASMKKAVKLGAPPHDFNRPAEPSRLHSATDFANNVLLPAIDVPVESPSSPPSVSEYNQGNDVAMLAQQQNQGMDVVTVHRHIFPRNIHPPAMAFEPPEPDARLIDTPQLACCLGLLQATSRLEDILDSSVRNWVQTAKDDTDELERLKTLATDVIRAFKRDEFKDAKAVTEVVYLAPVLEKDDFRYLLREFHSGIEQSTLLDVHQLEGLAQLIQGADKTYLVADDLVKVLELLSTRLRNTHQQSTGHLYQLTLAVSHVLDAMADVEVKGLDRENLHEPLLSYLDELRDNTDAYLVYQAAYAYQALLCVPDDEKLWQAALRRTKKVAQGVSGLVSAVKGIDLSRFLEGLEDIQEGMAGASGALGLVRSAYDGATTLVTSGRGFLKCLNEGLSFNRKCAWYSALRGADTLIRDGNLAEFRKLVCEAPCRRDPAFQWGVCQRLGELAINPTWDFDTRREAIVFLGEIYANDAEWGQQPSVKQWILGILIKLSPRAGGEMKFAETILEDLQKNGDAAKQELCQECLRNDSGSRSHPLKVAPPAIGSPSLLDRVQGRPDVEGNIRQIRRRRLKEYGNAVYIPPQAKASLQASDEACFALMEKVEEFLRGSQMVFLLLGDSGAGKSTFNRALECSLWESYDKKSGIIPLYISLPAIDKPEHDMIAKQLRKAEFTETQIRELKLHRKFVLICDGYDESQLTHNLYIRNHLNEPGEWQAKMVISCRSEYIGIDYRDRFQPSDRNHRSDSSLFQEAVITPFSLNQVQDYIDQYVSVHRPLWEAKEYKEALDRIPSLKELVKNPFLMSLSLEVLPRMVDRDHDFSTTYITRVALYDQFIEHWLERNKKRLGEKNLNPQARVAFDNLTGEGFTQNGIDFLKKLSVAIYKNQGGQPIVRYSRYKDEGTWKNDFFGREDEKQLLREACPLTRNGNQHRFIHRTLLEYGFALAVFDPQDWKEKAASEASSARRMSVDSSFSFDTHDVVEVSTTVRNEPDLESPLAQLSFANDASVLQFLEERVQQEPLFKQQLLNYIEHSKVDKKWRIGASNAITVLVRAGHRFIRADLRGIQIPKADLSYGMFDSAQLQGADLRQVNLRSVWLRLANLSNAQMAGVQFGEPPFLKQESPTQSIVYSPDGNSIAVALESGHVIIYSTSTSVRLWTLKGHSESVLSITYSTDGKYLASGGMDSTVRLWDVKTGDCIRILTGHNGPVKCVAFSFRGDQIASSGDDYTVKLWNVETGECCHTLTGHDGQVDSAVYSRDGSQLASGSYDYTVRLWIVEKGECSHILIGHKDEITKVVYSPQGEQIASASYDKTVRLWNVATGECCHVLTALTQSPQDAHSVTYSPRGGQVAFAEADKVWLWNVETGVLLHVLDGHSSGVFSIAYSPPGDLIASASNDKTVQLWDAETGACRQILAGHSNLVSRVVFSPNGDQVASSGGRDDMTVRLWDVRSGSARHVPSGHNGYVSRVISTPNGARVATCSYDTTARVWDAETGECRHILRDHTDSLNSIVSSPQGDKFATCSWDTTVRLWNAETGVCSHTLTGHNDKILWLACASQGNLLASCSDDRTVRLWSLESGECLNVLKGHNEQVYCVVFSPDGSQVASCSMDKTVRLWDVETGVCSYRLIGHTHWVTKVVYSPHGDHVASAGEDNIVRVWEAATGACCRVLNEHSKRINSIDYSPDGILIASASDDKNVRLWNVEAGACCHVLGGHSDKVRHVVFSPRGDLLASASDDKTVQLWNVESGQCKAVIQSLPDWAMNLAWVKSSDVPLLVNCCIDGSVWMWELTGAGDSNGLYQVRLRWSSMKNALIVADTMIQDVKGLSSLNKQLLKQRGAVGDPHHHE